MWEHLYKYVWDGAKIIHKRKFIFLSTYITKERCWNTVRKTQQKMIEKQSKPNKMKDAIIKCSIGEI